MYMESEWIQNDIQSFSIKKSKKRASNIFFSANQNKIKLQAICCIYFTTKMQAAFQALTSSLSPLYKKHVEKYHLSIEYLN